MVISLENLIKSKVKTLDELKKIRKAREKEMLVFASGCFDIVHTDHIEYLAWSRWLGDYLIVAINSDKSVKKLKSDNRPIISLKNRIKLIASNYFVDYITVFDKPDTVEIIKTLKPDIFARGKDQVLDKRWATKEKRVMNQEEKRAVESYGGKICFLDKLPKYSTTRLIKLIKNGH
jgi:D-beta-D-heptose 7-phosphate kinase/D-beta-D-heptose 1-phosphate adenosyltransferase